MTAAPPSLGGVVLFGAGGLDLDPGEVVFIGARARNSVGLWSEVKWSEQLGIGTMELVLSPGDRATVLYDGEPNPNRIPTES